ncbi:SRR1-domain-containing protein [Phycomyces nitens]|nr:SRR1-domain-containing protein [Phycomyces nitens]
MPTPEPDQDGFVVVEKAFKYKPIDRKKKGRNRRNENKHVFKDCDDWTLDDIKSTLGQRKEALIESRFYKELSGIFDEHLISTTPHDIICYGIGSMQKSKNAQYQFELALLIRQLLKIPGKMYIYDPVMTDLDKEVCTEHKIDIIEENEEGKRVVTKPTLFYMPHCGRGLYSNTLSVNWTKENLKNITIIGNRFDMYVGSQLDRDLKRECPYLIPAVEITEAVSFPKEFDNNQIFNDLSIQKFIDTKMSIKDKKFWDPIPVTIPGSDKDTVQE